MFKKILDKILDLIYPNKCVLCNQEIVKRKDYLCKECSTTLNLNGKSFYIESGENRGIKCLSAFEYTGNIKSAIWRFKFKGYKNYSEFFANIMSKEIQSIFKDIKFDFICFVPLRKERKRNRGYNQSQCVAEGISIKTNIPCKDALVKIKNNHVQHELDLASRRENVKGVYEVSKNCNVKGKTILLCDDIVTSGNTLSECAKILLEAGAHKVYCVTIAYIPKRVFSNKNQ